MHKKILNDEVYECYFLKEQNDFFITTQQPTLSKLTQNFLLLGRPLPQVTWWRDNYLLNTTSIQIIDKKVKNTLQLPKLERKDLHNSYVCQASNNDVTHPLTSSVTLDLNCKEIIERMFCQL